MRTNENSLINELNKKIEKIITFKVPYFALERLLYSKHFFSILESMQEFILLYGGFRRRYDASQIKEDLLINIKTNAENFLKILDDFKNAEEIDFSDQSFCNNIRSRVMECKTNYLSYLFPVFMDLTRDE